MKKVEFVEIKGFEGFEVSKEGKIRSTKSRKYKKTLLDKACGKEYVRFKKNGSNVTVYLYEILANAFPKHTESGDVPECAEPASKTHEWKYDPVTRKFDLDDSDNEDTSEVKSPCVELTIGKDKKARKARKGCKHILEVETGKVWNGFGGIVNTYGYKYDTFYDKFYYSKTGKVEYEGRKFELVSECQEV